MGRTSSRGPQRRRAGAVDGGDLSDRLVSAAAALITERGPQGWFCHISCTEKAFTRRSSRLAAGSTASSGCEPASWSRARLIFW